MMKKSKNRNGVVKGVSSGLVISILVHAVALAVAGLCIVFTVFPPTEEPPFKPPVMVERKKMKLIQPKVNVKRRATPKNVPRIMTVLKDDITPQIKLPDAHGLGGTGIGDGIEGFNLIPPDLETLDKTFGDPESVGNDLEVTFYNLARDKDGGDLPNMSHQEFFAELRSFVQKRWNTSVLSKYYSAPHKLYATTIMIPAVASAAGPDAFGESMDYGYCWAAHYRGKLVHKDGITFRFWGAADDVLTVAINKKVVLAANFEWTGVDAHTIADNWVSSAPNNRAYKLANNYMVGGDWITMEPGVYYDFDAIAGEGPGGEFNAQLLVEVKGEHYPKNSNGTPTFPIFAMAKPSWALQDSILMNMIEGEANVTNVTTIFSDY